MTETPTPNVQDIVTRYQRFYSGLIFDQLDERGFGDLVLANDIKPILPDMKIAGPAFTVKGELSSDSAPGHNQVQLEMFSKFEPYSIEVIEAGGDTSSAHFGGLNATACIARNVTGTVTDGGTRDTHQLLALNYPVFCRFRNPVAATGRWKVIAYQTPIKLPGALIAEVAIHPGDFIFGDIDGVVVVPRHLTLTILEACEDHLGIEKVAMGELATGEDVVEVFKRYGKF
ncbi:MAG: RraA family protein [Anaerolineae bacterium]